MPAVVHTDSYGAAKRAGAAAERCLFVDDRPENVAAAVALGMTGVVYGGPTDLRAALANFISPARRAPDR
ncbi:HAD-IA family hydrolase [Microtetraspora malaysiensis]|uniref:HAD-IA family hydrolase n=1 Tax=Microtetraspora malaysiensis TaxID=161358 RepID=UPI003D8AF1F8